MQGRSYPQKSFMEPELEKQVSRSRLSERIGTQMDRVLMRGTLADGSVTRSARKLLPERAPHETGKAHDTSDPEAGWAIKNDEPVGHGRMAHVAVNQTSETVCVRPSAPARSAAIACSRARRKKPAASRTSMPQGTVYHS